MHEILAYFKNIFLPKSLKPIFKSLNINPSNPYANSQSHFAKISRIGTSLLGPGLVHPKKGNHGDGRLKTKNQYFWEGPNPMCILGYAAGFWDPRVFKICPVAGNSGYLTSQSVPGVLWQFCQVLHYHFPALPFPFALIGDGICN
jgi:hypothetical protein